MREGLSKAILIFYKIPGFATFLVLIRNFTWYLEVDSCVSIESFCGMSMLLMPGVLAHGEVLEIENLILVSFLSLSCRLHGTCLCYKQRTSWNRYRLRWKRRLLFTPNYEWALSCILDVLVRDCIIVLCVAMGCAVHSHWVFCNYVCHYANVLVVRMHSSVTQLIALSNYLLLTWQQTGLDLSGRA